jgi:very-short-patch-repair endonuclease/DNA polymerase III delta prime subunit
LSDGLEQSLELARLELLDMGLRGNTLLNCRSTANTLPIIGELSSQVYHVLVENQQSMGFLPAGDDDAAADEGNAEGEGAPEQELAILYTPDQHTDTKLQTRLSAEKLDRRLLKISNEAKTYYDEQGVEILYLAVGFLAWYEDPSSSLERLAPLILIPVELVRSSAMDLYKLKFTEGDIGPNLTLAAKLKSDFRIILPEFPEELAPEAYYAEVAEAIRSQPRWRVDSNRINLGFFSFGKFQMYQDLDPAKFPEDAKPWNHPILKALLSGAGFLADAFSGLDSAAEPESQPKLVELNFVKDADSSQTQAVMAVKSGSHLVIQGPPGTGKSQTITNIIAELLAENKKVLFVSEKMAALEVVKRRLDECHLGEAVLELHSHKSNRKAVLGELKRCLEQGFPSVPDRSYEQQRHQDLERQLDEYCAAVNTPILNSGITYVEALGHHLGLGPIVTEGALPLLSFTLMRDWSASEYSAACSRVSELVNHLEHMGVPADNPFSTSRLADFSPIRQNALLLKLNQTEALIGRCNDASADIAQAMELPVPQNLDVLRTLHRAATRAQQAPHVVGLKLTANAWQQRRDGINALLDAGKTMQSLRERHSSVLIEQAWSADVLELRGIWATTGMTWWRVLSGDFRRARRMLQGLVREELPKAAEESLALIDDILGYQAALGDYRQHEQLGASVFGAQWQGLQSDWAVLASLSAWVIALHQEVADGLIPAAILRFLEGGPELSGWAASLAVLAKTADGLEASIEELMATAMMRLPGGPESTAATVNLNVLQEHIGRWRESLDSLYPMTRYNQLVANLDTPALADIAQLSFDWRQAPAQLLATLQASWYSGLVEEAYNGHPAIQRFDRISQEQAIEDFRRLDRELFVHAQEHLVGLMHKRIPSMSGGGEIAIIRREMNKKRRLMPIRKLIKEAGRAIQQIKPVFMMSPMSVATYLEQQAVDFDVVIFDEASQVKVVDAMGALLRGKQAVVVGDTKQMPPTDFFSRALELDEDEAEASQTADIESILGMFLAQGAPERMLRWHYRSRHDSLIAVSNEEFYEGKLMIFPSPGVNPYASGLKFRHLPDTTYDRGGSRTNAGEARAVAEAVMLHARERPQLTLGVVAFSTAQRDCLLLEVERLRRENPETEAFFTAERADGETFFIKNLENVQGDERDIIFISIGYGMTAAGRLSQSFGPINREGGERRLNVLITRSRLGMEVFANFTGDMLQTTATTPFGVRALKNFLTFAESGNLQRHHETGRSADSPFEKQVLAAITAMGYEVEPQVGSAGFFIDLAVRDPGKPGRYALAVECDGASYHSSASARDRDRLRQDVLEGLGWRFHRIWSTDWFRNQRAEIERLQAAIEAALRALQAHGNGAAPSIRKPAAKTEALITRQAPPALPPSAAVPYPVFQGALGLPGNIEPHELSDHHIHKALVKLINHEGPMHADQAARRLLESVGVARIGSRINQRFEEAFRTGSRQKLFHYKQPFLYANSECLVPIRDRSNLPAALKNIEHVPPVEVAAAITEVVAGAFTIQRAEAVSSSLALLGFQRATKKAYGQVDAVVQQLIAGGQLKESGAVLSILGG